MASSHEQIAVEQANANVLYARIDELIAHLEEQLRSVMGEQGASTHQNRSERDSFASFYEDRISLLRSVSQNVLFGRLDMQDSATHYIGRIGVFAANREQLLVDWRAPAAAAFYQATPKNPLGVRLRRHLLTQDREIVSIEDDVLDQSVLSAASESSTLQGEGALLAAVSSKRTGRMGDIVATIQAEQDTIIRHPSRGVLVVQGGPGTGKTAVALHRAAYQLYTHRARLEHSGVLIVAPSRHFMRYIERVLPSLGESGVVMLTPGELVPGVQTEIHDPPHVAMVKGRMDMAKVLKRALRARQLIPTEKIPLNIDGVHISLSPQVVRKARAEARNTGRPHNQARNTFVRSALDALVEDYRAELKRLGRSYFEEDRSELLSDLRSNHDVKVALNRCWLPYTPQSFLRSLFASKDRLLHASAQLLCEQDALLLVRSKDCAWTVEDVPLLDEVAELLGEDDAAARQEESRRSAQDRQHVEYATKVLEMMDANGIVSAQDLAQHVGSRRDRRTLAERAGADRTWTYGHIVVDEAQEHSAMMWRLLMRRNPTKCFTIVGDVAQTSAAAGASAWDDTLRPFVDDRATIQELTVNYRTPAHIMSSALEVAKAHGLDVSPVTSVREGDHPVDFHRAEAADAATSAARVARDVFTSIGGRLAILCPPENIEECTEEARALLGQSLVGTASQGTDRPVTVMDPMAAKGLEFDSVVLLHPELIVNAHSRGANDLYVAMTRPTQKLDIVYTGELPRGLNKPQSTD